MGLTALYSEQPSEVITFKVVENYRHGLDLQFFLLPEKQDEQIFKLLYYSHVGKQVWDLSLHSSIDQRRLHVCSLFGVNLITVLCRKGGRTLYFNSVKDPVRY
jgi:hypothetical protein